MLSAILDTGEKSLDIDLTHDRDTLVEVVDGMDQIVFDDYIKRRSRGLVEVMENGILRSGIDWLNASKPTGSSAELNRIHTEWRRLTGAEVRPYMHKAILMLVEAHAKIGDTLIPSAATGGLVNRVLIALVTALTEVALRCFQQVPKYGTGGMLTVSRIPVLDPKYR